MKTVLLLKEIYVEGFKNLGNYIIERYFKAFTWFTVGMLVVVLFAFLFRLFTGFAFQ